MESRQEKKNKAHIKTAPEFAVNNPNKLLD